MTTEQTYWLTLSLIVVGSLVLGIVTGLRIAPSVIRRMIDEGVLDVTVEIDGKAVGLVRTENIASERSSSDILDSEVLS